MTLPHTVIVRGSLAVAYTYCVDEYGSAAYLTIWMAEFMEESNMLFFSFRDSDTAVQFKMRFG